MASLGIEFGASRLLAPYFGTSLYVWGVLIGLVLIYLSVGYVIGGRLADRRPDDALLFQITAWAGLWIGITPLVSYPILLASQQGFRELSVGLVAGTLLAVLLMFANGVSCEEVPGDSAARQLEGHRLSAIFAELKRARVLRVRPRASRTVEPVGLVHREQRLATLEDNALFPQCLGGRLQRAPAASW